LPFSSFGGGSGVSEKRRFRLYSSKGTGIL
jgi:hypothetical protein